MGTLSSSLLAPIIELMFFNLQPPFHSTSKQRIIIFKPFFLERPTTSGLSLCPERNSTNVAISKEHYVYQSQTASTLVCNIHSTLFS